MNIDYTLIAVLFSIMATVLYLMGLFVMEPKITYWLRKNYDADIDRSRTYTVAVMISALVACLAITT